MIESKSYLRIVTDQFKKRKSALISLWIIIFLFFVAIFAPFLANDKPLVLYTSYGEHFNYFLSSFRLTKASYIENLASYDNLIEEKQKKLALYDDLKNNIYNFNKQNDLYGNKYEDLKEEIDRLSSTPSQSEETALKIKPLKEERKKVGAKQNEIKAKMLALNIEREALNISLVQLDTSLDLKASAELISNSLENLLFTLKEDIAEEVFDIAEEYDNIFYKHSYGTAVGEDTGLFIKKLNNLEDELNGILSEGSSADYLKKSFSFPAFSSLGFIDILFMSIFLVFIIYPIIKALTLRFLFKGRDYKFSYKVLLHFCLFIFIFSFFYFVKSGSQIPTNYKKLLSSNFSSSIYIDNEDDGSFAIFPPVVFSFNENVLEEKLQKPSLFSDNNSRHILGTDDTGRDVLSRMIWGSRVSLSVGFVAVFIYVGIGIFVGAIAGYFGGTIDMLISRVIEVVICFPSFFLILTIIAFVGPSITNIMIIIGLTSWPGIARLVRGEFLNLRNEDFVVSAKALGASDFKIIFKYILPNSLTPVLVSATFGIASSMLIEAGLSFLGFGVREPFPSWGMMISSGQGDVLNYWWLSLIPGIAIFVAVTSYNLLGDALREALDPKLK